MNLSKMQNDLKRIKEILSQYLNIESPDHISSMGVRKPLQEVASIITEYKNNVDDLVFKNHLESLRTDENEEELKKIYEKLNIVNENQGE